jgi:hypothetical protein
LDFNEKNSILDLICTMWFLLFLLVASESKYPCFPESRIDFNHHRRFSFLPLFFGFWWPRGVLAHQFSAAATIFFVAAAQLAGAALCLSPSFCVRSGPRFLPPAQGSLGSVAAQRIFFGPGPFSFVSFFDAVGQRRLLLGLTASFFFFSARSALRFCHLVPRSAASVT